MLNVCILTANLNLVLYFKQKVYMFITCLVFLMGKMCCQKKVLNKMNIISINNKTVHKYILDVQTLIW